MTAKLGYDVIFAVCSSHDGVKIEVNAQELKSRQCHFYWLVRVAAAVALLDGHPKCFDTVFGRWTVTTATIKPASQ